MRPSLRHTSHSEVPGVYLEAVHPSPVQSVQGVVGLPLVDVGVGSGVDGGCSSRSDLDSCLFLIVVSGRSSSMPS